MMSKNNMDFLTPEEWPPLNIVIKDLDSFDNFMAY